MESASDFFPTAENFQLYIFLPKYTLFKQYKFFLNVAAKYHSLWPIQYYYNTKTKIHMQMPKISQ